jgi:hypothetical protein
MKDNSMNQKQFEKKIEKFLNDWEKENKQLKENLEKFKNNMISYFEEGEKTQEEYINNIEKISKIKNVKECENFINEISEDIPSHITVREVQPLMINLIKDMKEQQKKLKEVNLDDDESIKKVVPKEQGDKAIKLEKEKKQLQKNYQENLEIMAEQIPLILSLSREKWSFLWNLASWKFNAILSKEMRKYSFWVMILTIIVVIFMIISVGVQLI